MFLKHYDALLEPKIHTKLILHTMYFALTDTSGESSTADVPAVSDGVDRFLWFLAGVHDDDGWDVSAGVSTLPDNETAGSDWLLGSIMNNPISFSMFSSIWLIIRCSSS